MELVVGMGEFPSRRLVDAEMGATHQVEFLEEGEGTVDRRTIDGGVGIVHPFGDLLSREMPFGRAQRGEDKPSRAGKAVAVFPEYVTDIGSDGHVFSVQPSRRKYERYPIANASQHQYDWWMIVALHAPDGFLEPGTAIVAGIISLVVIGFALRQSREQLKDKAIPLAGITAAFIFAAQMFNFPVVAGTTGHLLGGALAAILLGPSVGAIIVTIVVVVQALAFADGGLTALGYNVLNMAIVPAYGGYAVFVLLRRVFPSTAGGVVGATGIAAWASVVMAAVAFSIEWLFGASAPVAFDTVFGSMVGVHALIGIGEGIISALAVGAVLASRPDLVYGAQDLDQAQLTESKVGTRTFVIGGMLVALVFAAVVSQFAVDNPDGLEKVAEDTGFIESAQEHSLADSLFADYATSGISNEALSLAVAGIVGTVVALLVAFGLFMAVRETRNRDRASV